MNRIYSKKKCYNFSKYFLSIVFLRERHGNNFRYQNSAFFVKDLYNVNKFINEKKSK